MVYHEGYYYLTTTTWNNIQITRATTINGLKSAAPKVIWTDSNPSRCCNMWAPEVHWMAAEGRWFVYYTAGTAGSLDNQRIHTLKSSGTNIWDSTWSYSGRIVIPNRDIWAIDQTILRYGGNNYLVYSSWNGPSQCLYISQMTSATTVGNTVLISTPTLSWEMVDRLVNEGPAAIYGNGRIWIVYSASFCVGTGYKLGRLELTGTNPLSASSWTKYGSPILQGANGNYEPGHNGFFTGPSGDVYIVYHASSTSPGTFDGRRYTMIQPVEWNPDGTPRMQPPASFSTDIREPR
ncbi:Arabinanase/levansucrase/invertase [Serendipita vermifera]|nr:Arabinanase/levansucrase/invertase [Serendipita vermifera]